MKHLTCLELPAVLCGRAVSPAVAASLEVVRAKIKPMQVCGTNEASIGEGNQLMVDVPEHIVDQDL